MQNTPGEALTKDELQSGVDAANDVAESYQRSMKCSKIVCMKCVFFFLAEEI